MLIIREWSDQKTDRVYYRLSSNFDVEHGGAKNVSGVVGLDF